MELPDSSPESGLDIDKGAWRELRSIYRTKDGPLSDLFFKPCLHGCVRYRRAAGYFSSSALVSWASALRQADLSSISVDLLISPELSEHDRAAFVRATSRKEQEEILTRSGESLVEALVASPDDAEHRANLLIWLIASERLKIQFALPRHLENSGMFHQKTGIFDFPDGSQVGFDGSANETDSGYRRNYESVQVFRSWVPSDFERLTLVSDEFDVQWTHRDDELLVVPMSDKSLSLIRTRVSEEAVTQKEPLDPKSAATDDRWKHQSEAADAFIQARRGILEMATGTGKTKTSLRIAERLMRDNEIDSVIVATDGNDLLDQWCTELLTWRTETHRQFTLFRHYRLDHHGMTFCLRPANAVLVVSRTQLGKFLAILTNEQATRTLVIHDEVHGAGAPETRASLAGKHQRYGYVLGLSATPEREYDASGTAFLESEIGLVIYRFGLEDAIQRGILVEFDYVPLPYDLSPDDRLRLKAVYSMQAARKREGRPMSQEELWMELSRVYKTAEYKPLVLAAYIEEHPEILLGCIVFVEEMSYGERILPLLHDASIRYRTYYAETDRENLKLFGRGEIDCLVTCHRLSQGIDIQSLKTVILMSSPRARLETIQRIGRCLRRNPMDESKRAIVVDFIVDKNGTASADGADGDRKAWLEQLSNVRRGETHADR